jgi:hypothetical protein
MASIVATTSPVILELRLVRFWQAILGMKHTLAWRLASGCEGINAWMFGGPDGTVSNPRGYDGIGVIAEEGGPLAKPGIEENRGSPARKELRTGDDLSGSEARY